MAIQPRIAANKTANTITVRARRRRWPRSSSRSSRSTTSRAPRSIIDVQILEVSRERAKRFGLNLTDYALGAHLLARAGARRRPAPTAARRPTAGTADGAVERRSPPVFNANTISTRHQRRRLLPGRAGRDRAVPRDRLADQDRGQAAAARRGRAEGHAEPRRGSAGAEHDLHADRAGRRRRQSADVVHLPADRRHRRDDAARHLRGRHRHGSHAREQRPRPGLDDRRPDAAGVRARARSRRGCGCATASRTCWPGLLREDERRVAARASPASCGCRCCSSCSPTTTPTSGRPTS